MAIPQNMLITPHDYQLKGAAQADWACKGPFKGIMVGHEMGVGNTLLAILAMWLCRDDPGMCLVVAPVSLCGQWVTTIERSWEEVGLYFHAICNGRCLFLLFHVI